MNRHHRLCLSVPSRVRAHVRFQPKKCAQPRLPRFAAIGLLACALLVAGCGADEAAEGEASTESEVGGGQISDAETVDAAATAGADDTGTSNRDEAPADADADPADRLTFGDPVDYGFAPIDDEDVALPDPVDAIEGGRPALSAPDVVIPAIAEELSTAPETGETLDSIALIDESDQAGATGDGGSLNSSGEAATLDDEAALACANVEIALGHFDEGRASIAAERLAIATGHATKSGQSTVRDWAAVLGSVGAEITNDDLAVVVGFIAACAERGYEL